MTIKGICAACGLPGHRYGTTDDGGRRYDPVGCINSLRGELEAAHKHLAEGATMMEALLADREALAEGIREHDRRMTMDGGGIARCTPVMGELLDEVGA